MDENPYKSPETPTVSHTQPAAIAVNGWRTVLICFLVACAWVVLAIKWIGDRPSPSNPFGRSSEFGIYAALLLAYSIWFGRKLWK